MICYRLSLLLALNLFCHAVTHADSEVVSSLLEKHPYDFAQCEKLASLKAQCVEPPGLEMITITSDINIEVILDSSGSMAGRIDGISKAKIAADALKEFVKGLPGHVNLALRVYGHKGSNDEAQKQQSCEGSSQLYPFQKLDRAGFMQAVEPLTPTGWTPLGLSLERALEDFNRFDSETNNNIIYLITDGVETCDGDPVAAAKAIAGSNVKAVVNVIGFDVDNADTKGLLSVAQAGGGKFFSASNLDELKQVLVSETSWRQWREYVRCRRDNARVYLVEYQQKSLDMYNCVLDTADATTAALETALGQSDLDDVKQADIMMQIFAEEELAIAPYSARYADPAEFEKYQSELDALEALEKDVTQ